MADKLLLDVAEFAEARLKSQTDTETRKDKNKMVLMNQKIYTSVYNFFFLSLVIFNLCSLLFYWILLLAVHLQYIVSFFNLSVVVFLFKSPAVRLFSVLVIICAIIFPHQQQLDYLVLQVAIFEFEVENSKRG